MRGQTLFARLIAGCVAGAAIAAVDNFAFGGEISPIFIVGMLLLAAGAAGAIWGPRGVITSAIIWVWLPAAHLVKHVLRLPDTIQPNTYASILELGISALSSPRWASRLD